MAYVLESGDALRVVVMGVAALIGIGASVAWIPAIKFDSMVIPARLFLAATIIIMALGNPVAVVLGAILAAVAVMLWWQTQVVPEVPRPHLLGVVIISLATGAAAYAALTGWSSLGRLPDAGRGVVAVVVAAVGALAVLAASDRSRVRLRDAIRRRFHPVDIQLVPAAGTDSVFADENDDLPATTLSEAIEADAARAVPQQRVDIAPTITVEQLTEPDDEMSQASDEPESSGEPNDDTAAGQSADTKSGEKAKKDKSADIEPVDDNAAKGNESSHQHVSADVPEQTAAQQSATEQRAAPQTGPKAPATKSAQKAKSSTKRTSPKPRKAAAKKASTSSRSTSNRATTSKSTGKSKTTASKGTSTQKRSTNPKKTSTSKGSTSSKKSSTPNSSTKSKGAATSSASNGQQDPTESKSPATNEN